MKIQGVIFDMDGLMFDTERLFSHYWTDACRDYGIPRKEEFVQAVRGSSGEKMLACVRRYYGEELDAQAFCRRCYEYVDEYLKTTVPKKKGLDELLAWLKARGLPAAVASSTYRSLVERNLRTAGVEEYFRKVVTGDQVEHGKPAPDIFLLAARQLGLAPGNCLVLEDSFNGVRAGAAAGCVTVMIPDLSQPTPELLSLCSGCLEDLGQVPDFIERYEG
ncbi:HAD family phosphatase [Fournierella massiliensis]|nr:HAD family phosphatase [Fournierella massiliensis]MCF2557621.1 HAD family phosphatase [Fournierella massiliensis]